MTPNFTGTWKANLERSKLLGPIPRALLVKINHAELELNVEMLITKPDGSEDRLLFKGLTTGEEVINSVHGVEVRSRCRWKGMELLIESWMKLGERQGNFRDYWSASSDGRKLTMEHRDDDLAGQITLLEKTDGR
jgi:hypothetical protein